MLQNAATALIVSVSKGGMMKKLVYMQLASASSVRPALRAQYVARGILGFIAGSLLSDGSV